MSDSRYASTSTRLPVPCFRSPGNDRFETQCWTAYSRISLRVGASGGAGSVREDRHAEIIAVPRIQTFAPSPFGTLSVGRSPCRAVD